jgi:peptidyl-prolyl cis-trans isomerase C
MIKTWIIPSTILVLFSCGARASAQTLAKVGGVPITLQQVIGANPAAKTDKKVEQQVLVALINRQAILNEAHKLGLQNSPQYKSAISQAEDNTLIQITAAKFSKDHPITQTELQAGYNKAFNRPMPEEYRLREILVPTASLAKSIINQIKQGKSFSSLAFQYSKDTQSGALGGEIGWQVATAIYAPVLKDLNAMKVGQVSGPISTPSGFVIIQLLDKRLTPKPTLEQVKPALTKDLMQHAWIEHIIKLRSAQNAHLIVPLAGN